MIKKNAIQEKAPQKEKRLATKIPTSLHTNLKVIAVKQNKTMEEIICEVLEKEVEKHKNYL
jgi:predicted HicB family RNase H-like nuclease